MRVAIFGLGYVGTVTAAGKMVKYNSGIAIINR